MHESKKATRNFAADILREAAGEPIEAIVIGEFGGGGGHKQEDGQKAPEQHGRLHVVLPWDQAGPLLDYDYDDDYGAPSCHAIYAWTPTRVIFVSEYDGSTRVLSLPRHPVAEQPVMPGGD